MTTDKKPLLPASGVGVVDMGRIKVGVKQI
jgi:hypothetical protein